MQLSRMPSGAHSTASASVRAATPARAALLCATWCRPRGDTTRLTMLPALPAACQWRPMLCTMLKVPVRLVSMTARQPFSVKSTAACGNCPPALLTSRSTLPRRANRSANSASTAPRSRMSSACASHSRPRAPRASRTRATLASVRPQTMTRAPRRAASHAVARPMPLPPPDTTTVQPLKSPAANTQGWASSCASDMPKPGAGSGGGPAWLMGFSRAPPEEFAADDELAHFCGAGADLEQLDGAVQAIDLRLPDVAAAAMDLHCLGQYAVHGLGSVHH